MQSIINISWFKKYKLNAKGSEEMVWVSSKFAIRAMKEFIQILTGKMHAYSCKLMKTSSSQIFWCTS